MTLKNASLVCIFLLCSLKGAAQFTFIPTSTVDPITDIAPISNNILIQGRFNYLSKSIDGCETLLPLNPAEPFQYLGSLVRLDSNTAYTGVYSFGSRNAIYKTKDNGQSWQLLLDTTNQFIQYIHFFDTLEGFATCNFQKRLYTKDGGITWKDTFYLGNNPPSCADGDQDSTFAVNTGGGGLFITFDRGRNWIVGATGGFDVSDVKVINSDTIFAVSTFGNGGGGSITFSRILNKGQDWVNIDLFKLLSFADPYNVCYKNNEIYIIGLDTFYNLAILKTKDLGNTWSIYNSNIPVFRTFDMQFINDSIAIIAGDSGKLLRWNKNQTVFVGLEKVNLDPSIEKLQLFPNPAHNSQTLILNTKSIASLKIDLMDITGKRIKNMYNGITESGKNKIELDIAQIPSGIYFYEVRLAIQNQHIRFVKQ
jgi:photosystem II stability/assembly factor-like uncharacterized protein